MMFGTYPVLTPLTGLFEGSLPMMTAGKLLKTQERETGIEPATSSLGNWRSIENKWRQYTPSLPRLAPQPRATKRASFHGTTKQCLFSFLLCNALTRCDLSIRLVDILEQLKSFNQPIILRRVQNNGSTASPLCEHEGTLVRLHLLDQLGSVRPKRGNRLDILLYV
jgi:hypothetical protein